MPFIQSLPFHGFAFAIPHLLPTMSSCVVVPTLVVVSLRRKTWRAVRDPGQLQPAGRTGELPGPSDAMR